MAQATGEWLFDLGNTRLKFAPVLSGGEIGETVALAHVDGDIAALPLPQGAVAQVASVASVATTVGLLDGLARRFGRVQIARTQAHCGQLRIAYAEPTRLGVDRFLSLLAAHRRDAIGVLVVAVGTALTIDLLDAGGLHRGGRIAPSPALMREALHARAVQLPATGGRLVEFAADTDDALASGCEGAALALVERSLAEARRLLGATPALLLHGGGMASLLPHLPQAIPVPGLVLEGLARWARIGVT
jgi:type III pantothenate kinase